MYAHSHGLEGMVRRGLVRTAAEVEELLVSQLAWSVLPSDGVALLNAHRAAAEGDLPTVLEIDRLLHALKLPAELRAASSQHGRRLLQETAPLVSHPLHAAYLARVDATKEAGIRRLGDSNVGETSSPNPPIPADGLFDGAGRRNGSNRREAPGCGAVAMGVVSHCLEIPAEWALLAYCHSYSVGVLSAGVRLVPVTHRQAQDILHRLQPLLLEAVRQISQRPWPEMTSFTPELDIASMRHEGGHQADDLRMFAS